MCFSTREHDLVDFAIGILGQQRSLRAIGSYGTTAVADREVAASQTVFVFHQMLRPVDKVLSGSAGLQHPREVGFTEHITKEVFRITGDPAIALSNRPLRIHGNKLIRAVFLPDAG